MRRMNARSIVMALALAGSTAAFAATAFAGGTTPVGAVLKIGKPAVIAYSNLSAPKVKGTVQVTPLAIVKGSIKDFANIKLTAAQKAATPYYLKISTKNVGKTDLSKTDPGRYLSGVDDRGQSQSPIIFFGDFDKCPDPVSATHLKPGQSYTECEAFLMAKGGSIVGAVWITFDPKHPTKSNITWKK
jgi:hypothetical protein